MADLQETVHHLLTTVRELKEARASDSTEHRAQMGQMRDTFQQELNRLTPSSTPRMDAPKPKEFTGHPNAVESFIHELNVYFHAIPEAYAHDSRKIAFAMTLMKDAASSWTQLRIGPEAQLPLPDTYDAYCQSIRDSFGGNDRKKAAIGRLLRARQTGSVRDYIN
ncbi:hypothetical protein GGF46_005323, partial [Coemansia sp. RSA 552]